MNKKQKKFVMSCIKNSIVYGVGCTSFVALYFYLATKYSPNIITGILFILIILGFVFVVVSSQYRSLGDDEK